VRNQELIHELEDKNRALAEAKKLLELSLDEREKELRRAVERLEALAMRDPLTGLYNHRSFQERIGEGPQINARYDGILLLGIADVDHFATYNEAHGHPAGDELLVGIARAISERLRPSDVVARYAGGQFALLAPGTGKRGAAAMCARIRHALAVAAIPGT